MSKTTPNLSRGLDIESSAMCRICLEQDKATEIKWDNDHDAYVCNGRMVMPESLDCDEPLTTDKREVQFSKCPGCGNLLGIAVIDKDGAEIWDNPAVF